MKDFDQILAEDPVEVGLPCSARRALSALDAEMLAGVERALADLNISGARIARGLRKLGHKVADSSVVDHRNQRCKCFRD